MKKRLEVVGKPRRRVDGRAKVTGALRFADDLSLPRMLHCKLLRSPHPHALVEEVNIEKAAAHPGVSLVLTNKDFPVPFGIMPVAVDEYPLTAHVRHVGDPVAAVIAVDEQTAVVDGAGQMGEAVDAEAVVDRHGDDAVAGERCAVIDRDG